MIPLDARSEFVETAFRQDDLPKEDPEPVGASTCAFLDAPRREAEPAHQVAE